MSKGKQVTGKSSGVMGRGRQRDNQINKHSGGQARSQTHICARGAFDISFGARLTLSYLSRADSCSFANELLPGLFLEGFLLQLSALGRRERATPLSLSRLVPPRRLSHARFSMASHS